MTPDHKYFDETHNLFHNQHVDDPTLDAAMEIPELEAIFANSDGGDYFNQILHVCVHQAWVLNKIEKYIEAR